MVRSSDMDTEILETDIGDVSAISEEGDEARSNVYEVGFHLLPTLSDEEVTSATKGIMDLLKKEGAKFVGDRFPAKISLAYDIQKRVSGKNVNYDSAYFGWVAFELSRDAIERVKALIDQNPSILRYLIVTTDRGAVAAALSGAVTGPVVGSSGVIEKPKREAEAGGEVSDTALNEALETMQAEDAKASE